MKVKTKVKHNGELPSNFEKNQDFLNCGEMRRKVNFEILSEIEIFKTVWQNTTVNSLQRLRQKRMYSFLRLL